MCGITGILGNGDISISNSMAACLTHRGPDGFGEFEEDLGNGSICLSQSRLAILDIHGSWQPIRSDHGCTLVQNGEIYNHQKIKRKLPNYSWQTSGDSETILALHRKFAYNNETISAPPEGKEIGTLFRTLDSIKKGNSAEKHKNWVSQLDGIWGFALWDSSSRELILSRDSMGVKPLLRTLLPDGTLLFGSEIKSFYSHPEFVARPDINALAVRLAYEYPLDNTTLFSGVTSVAPGSIETWSLDSQGRAVLTGLCHYNKEIISPDKSWDPKISADYLLQTLYSSVEARMMSDVPIGLVLSGGLDSSLLAALAKQSSESIGSPVPACWTVAGDEDNPDMIAAINVAKSQDLEHNTSIIDKEKFWHTLPNFVWSGEDLDISVLFWQPLFEAMSKKVKVGICGQGADELHAGYSRYKRLPQHAKLIDDRLSLFGDISIDKKNIGPGQPWINHKFSAKNNFSNLKDTLDFELKRGQLTNFQLRLGDRHSMAFGVEARVPFLSQEHRLAAHKLPFSWKLNQDEEKMALRAAAKLTNLPTDIVNRPKVPAGTATTPNIIDELISELKPHALEWASDYGRLSPLLKKQPDMSIGIRIFHAMHFSDRNNGAKQRSVMDIIDDVSDWSSL
jgi:asparagine synthase (glutamine-hydrolysing)